MTDLCMLCLSVGRIHGAAFDFHPDTYVLPGDREALHRAIGPDAGSSSSSLWIVKPVASSCGRGIRVRNTATVLALPAKKKVLVQRYLASPYLIDKKKFDLRIYVLVTGVDPLRVYIHEEGLTRISTSNYSLKNIKNRFAHLTNYSINKNSAAFKAASYDDDGDAMVPSDEDEDGGGGDVTSRPMSANKAPTTEQQQQQTAVSNAETEGFKWSLGAFRRWLTAREGKAVTETTFQRIHDLCVKTIIAAETVITPGT
jgi:hypothetical protein